MTQTQRQALGAATTSFVTKTLKSSPTKCLFLLVILFTLHLSANTNIFVTADSAQLSPSSTPTGDSPASKDQTVNKPAADEDDNDQFTREDGIVVLDSDNFQAALDKFDNLIVEFYATWCGHCQAFAPDYVQIAAQLKPNVTCAKVDAPEKHDLIEKYDIQGFPTIKLFRKNKEPENYSGFRSVEQVVGWATRKIGPPAVTLTSTDEFEAYKSSAEAVVVAYIKDKSSKEATTYLDVADSYDELKFAIIHDDDIAKAAKFDKEGIKLFKKFDEGEVAYDDDLSVAAKIKKFVTTSSIPLVVEFDQKMAQKIFGGDLKAHNLLFIKKTDSNYEKIFKQFRESAEKFKGRVLFVVIDADKDEHGRIVEYFGLKKEDLPSLRFIKLDDEMTKYKYPHDELVADKISEFSEGVLDGSIQPHLLSQDIPEDWDKQPVKVLVGQNFDKVVFDKTKNVIVKFYAPWCGHCKALAPIWDKLGEKYKDSDSVLVTKIDVAANELAHTKISSYPTIKLYKAESNEEVEFGAERTLEALSKFIDSQGDSGRAAPEDMVEETDEPEPAADGKSEDRHDEL